MAECLFCKSMGIKGECPFCRIKREGSMPAAGLAYEGNLYSMFDSHQRDNLNLGSGYKADSNSVNEGDKYSQPDREYAQVGESDAYKSQLASYSVGESYGGQDSE